MNLSAYIFHGIMVAAAASATIASSIGWGLDDPQRTEKSVREDSQRNQAWPRNPWWRHSIRKITFRRRLGYA